MDYLAVSASKIYANSALFTAMTQQVIAAVQVRGQSGMNATLTLINLIAHGVSVTDPLALLALADIKNALKGNVKL